MDGESWRYCKLFVDAPLSRTGLAGQIASALAGAIAPMATVVGPTWEQAVRCNEDFDAARRHEPEGGFLFFRYYLDIEALPAQTREAQVALVAHLLERLWERGHAAMAACDFEDELPKREDAAGRPPYRP